MPRMKRQIIFWWMISLLLPTRLLLRLLQIPKKGGHAEAILLFTSGTTGEPKGVVISHRNVVGNVSQFRELLDAKKDDAILASLPFFTRSDRRSRFGIRSSKACALSLIQVH